MSYRCEQKVRGHIYVYEVTSFWDKEKKQPRQKRVYLGKKDPSTGKIIKNTQRSPKPIGSRDIGATYLLKESSQKIKLLQNLKKVFPNDYEDILYLSFFKVIKREPYYLYHLWCDESYVSEKNKLSPKKINNLLSKIGQDELSIERFFQNWVSQHKSKSKGVMFDITSISSYGSGNDFLERGYNRDGENLCQTNLGVLSQDMKVDTKSSSASLPIAYRIYPGSINDVTTLHNILFLIKEYEMGLKCLVLDKGFYSQENIKTLHEKSLPYIVPMSFRTKIAGGLLEAFGKELISAKHAFTMNDKSYWHLNKKIEIGGVHCIANIYLDKIRRSQQESTATIKINDFEKTFSEKKFKERDECHDYINETLKSQKRFFSVKQVGKYFVVEKNIDSIEKEINKMGCVILLTNESSDLSRDEILSLYRKKDSIEKIFSSLKNDMNEKRLRVHSLNVARGSLFICFISLILISWIDHIMKENKLYKKFSKTEIYKILDRLKVYELATGQKVLGELSAKQKAIYSAFQVSKNIKVG